MKNLRRYLDMNNVTFFINPSYLVTVVVGREPADGGYAPWYAHLTMENGTEFRLWDKDCAMLCHRVVVGD